MPAITTAKLVALLLLVQPLCCWAFLSPPSIVPLTSSNINTKRLAVPSVAAASDLAIHLGVDVVAASVTAVCVAPLLAAFDEAITRSASGETNLWAALGQRLRQIVTQPGAFFQSLAFQWMWIVYACTYMTANSLKSIETWAGVSFGFGSTLAVTIVNMSCGIAKDSAYSKLFGCDGDDTDEGCKVTPKKAYLTWFLRDVLAFTFILSLPSMVATKLRIPLDVAKFTTPILAQYFTTVLHLLGFNMCNHPNGTMGDWIRTMKPTYFSTVAARQLRIIPPYSIGGILNGKLLSMAPLLVNLFVAGKT